MCVNGENEGERKKRRKLKLCSMKNVEGKHGNPVNDEVEKICQREKVVDSEQ